MLAVPGAVDLAAIEARVRTGLPTTTDLRRVVGARVPGLRLRIAEVDVDLVVVATGDVPAAEAVTRRAELGPAAAVALSAVTDAEALLASVGPDPSRFVALARQVKRWARVRGLDSAPFGGLPGLAWTVLAARTVRDAGDLSPTDLLREFFAEWAAWDWRQPITLEPARPDGPSPAAPGSAAAATAGQLVDPDLGTDPAVQIMTPSAPVRSCTEQVSAGGRDLLTRELYAAWELVDAAGSEPVGRQPPPGLLSPPPLHRRHAAWAVVTVRAVRGEAFTVTLGRVRGRVRALIAALERAGTPDVHGWPRPFETAPALTRYAVGLGQAPPDAARLAEIADVWAANLPGTGVELVPGGELPTLR